MTESGYINEIVIQHILPEGAFLQALSGSIPSGEMEFTADCNIAMVGLTRTTTSGLNVPVSWTPWGSLLTISTLGAGRDGRRWITARLEEGEMVYQMHYGTDGALHTRSGLWLTGFGSWVRRW